LPNAGNLEFWLDWWGSQVDRVFVVDFLLYIVWKEGGGKDCIQYQPQGLKVEKNLTPKRRDNAALTGWGE
jgi:hypothetical protein